MEPIEVVREELELRSQLETLRKSQNTAAAIPLIEEILPRARTFLGEANYQVMLTELYLAKCYLCSHKYFLKASPAKAEKVLQGFLKRQELLVDSKSTQLIEPLELLAISFEMRKNSDKFGETMERMISILKTHGKLAKMAQTYYWFGRFHYDSKRFELAEIQVLRGLLIYETLEEPDWTALSRITDLYQSILYAVGRANEIEPFAAKWAPVLDEADKRRPPPLPGPVIKPFSWATAYNRNSTN